MTVGIEVQIAAVAFMQDFLREPRRLKPDQISTQQQFLREAIASLRSLHPKATPHLEHCSAEVEKWVDRKKKS